ncbi:breast cancer type 1 susceptibility protein isoform X3 [Ambystoma mexicanum]|uniref:breast cancer type 1 susceptibility protein isoform X3 n=1 Tax=Ambystoma mexicanum TaxID=8296 RepID=UPI0037E978E3
MSSSVLDMEEVHDVLSIMGKNLECPICLELMKEPVTTKCDHIFCRFCMLKLLNKKKRGRAECPMCKHEITKRSLQDSPRFKLLVEGLLKTIQAFELDTGHKFSCSPDKGMKAFEVCSSEQLVKDMGLIVHSTGYRRRRKRVSMDGQENLGLILQETSSNVKLKKDLFQESPRRSKRQKLSSGKQVRLKSGSESSEEDLLEKAGSLRVGETDLLQTPDQGSDLEIEACEGCERETVDDPLSPRADAEEIILSDLAEYDFSERENESSRDVASRTEDFRTTASSLSEQNMPKNFGNAASNPLPRKCEGESNGAALQNDGECLSNKAKVPSTEVLSVTVMEKSPKRHSSGRKSKDCDLQEKEREASNQDHDCSYENESSLLHPDRSENSTPCSVSSKRVRTGVQRVTEWLSKLNEEMFALPPQDDYEPEVEALYTIRSKEKRHSGDSWASDKTEIMQNLLEVENCQSSSKPLLATIEDKIFGKTYKRERKSNPLLNISVLNDSKNIDDLAGDSVKECKDVRTPVLKRRRKLDLQPEDFIRRINTNDKNTSGICKGEAIVGQVPERKGVGAAFHFEVSPDDCTSKCNKSLDQPLLEDGCEYIVDRTIEQKDDPAAAVFNGCPLKCEVFDALSPGDITLVSETLKDKVKSNRTMMGPPIHAKDQTQAAQVKDLMSKRCKYQTQRVPALELVRRSEGVTDHEAVDTFSVLSSNNLIDLQIDSYPSSEERRKAKGGSISLRRSRRLLLQTEETSTLITLCNGSNKEEKPDQVNAGEDIVSGKEMTISVPSCSLSKVHVNLIDCNKLKSNGNHRKAGLHCEKQTLNHTPTDETALTDVKDLNTTMSEESIHWSPSELQNELEEANTQKSTSLLMVPPEQKDQMTYPLQNSHLIKEYSTCESSSDGLPITTSMDMILCGSKDLQHTKSQSPHINDSVLPVLSKEVDDSEQETELLLKTFKGAKRRSFILQPSPLPACTFEDPASPPSRDRTDTGQSDVKGEGSEYESEASHTGDSSGLSSQGEILTTQQRAIMQNNLEKLQKEMAVLQAVLEQNETQDLAVSSIPLQHNATDFPNGKVDSSEKSSSFTSKQDMEARSADDQLSVIPTFPCRREMEDVEYKSSPTPPPTPSRSQLTNRKTPEKVRHSMRLLKELKAAACAQDEDSQLVRVDQPEVPQEAEKSVDNRSEPVGFLAEKAAGTRRSSARVLSRLYENIGMTPSKPSPSALSSENNYSNSKDSLISPCITSKDRRRHSKRIERETGISTFVTPARVAAEPVMVKTPVVTNKRKISMVASGLNQSELLLVQKFSSKTKSTLSHQISDGTTHVIMKTDAELVCERTLKYFLGIAGRKWVVSYRWIVQCFKEGRILDEIDFEVRGDVINGRTHGGPRRARLSSENLLWKDFEICCSGSFTDMTTEHLEQMVTLCGGSVVKQPHLFTHDQFTAVLVVQPDACSEDTDFSAMKRKYNVTVVTREWMLDSVARYECQKFDAYLLPVS